MQPIPDLTQTGYNEYRIQGIPDITFPEEFLDSSHQIGFSKSPKSSPFYNFWHCEIFRNAFLS